MKETRRIAVGGRNCGKTAQRLENAIAHESPKQRAEKQMLVITSDPENISARTQFMISAARASGFRVDVRAEIAVVNSPVVDFVWWEETGVIAA